MRRTVVWTVAVLLAVAGLIQYVRAGEVLAPITQEELSQTQIFAYRDWQSSGVRVDVDSQVRIRAGGEWSYTPGEFHGPEGHARYRSPVFYPVRGVPGGILIGRIGETGRPFVVGKDTIHHTGQNEHGTLFLRINDDILSDNDGVVTIHVTVAGEP